MKINVRMPHIVLLATATALYTSLPFCNSGQPPSTSKGDTYNFATATILLPDDAMGNQPAPSPFASRNEIEELFARALPAPTKDNKDLPARQVIERITKRHWMNVPPEYKANPKLPEETYGDAIKDFAEADRTVGKYIAAQLRGSLELGYASWRMANLDPRKVLNPATMQQAVQENGSIYLQPGGPELMDAVIVTKDAIVVVALPRK